MTFLDWLWDEMGYDGDGNINDLIDEYGWKELAKMFEEFDQ